VIPAFAAMRQYGIARHDLLALRHAGGRPPAVVRDWVDEFMDRCLLREALLSELGIDPRALYFRSQVIEAAA
jgi:hypothetical protein